MSLLPKSTSLIPAPRPLPKLRSAGRVGEKVERGLWTRWGICAEENAPEDRVLPSVPCRVSAGRQTAPDANQGPAFEPTSEKAGRVIPNAPFRRSACKPARWGRLAPPLLLGNSAWRSAVGAAYAATVWPQAPGYTCRRNLPSRWEGFYTPTELKPRSRSGYKTPPTKNPWVPRRISGVRYGFPSGIKPLLQSVSSRPAQTRVLRSGAASFRPSDRSQTPPCHREVREAPPFPHPTLALSKRPVR